MAPYRLAGGCEFDAASGDVRRDDVVTRLEPQPAAVLALLIRRAGEVVTHDEIRRAVWGEDTHVNLQESVHYCVRQVRAALGERAADRRFIETLPRRGYRFLTTAVLEAQPSDVWTRPANGRRWRGRVAVACLVAALVAATAYVESRPNDHHQIAVAVLKALHDFIY